MHHDIQKIIEKLNLQPHIEGGHYKQTYQSAVKTHQIRSIHTTIIYLLESHDFSCWHRLKSDEIWHYYCGSALTLHQINET